MSKLVLTYEEKQVIKYIRKQASKVMEDWESYRNPEARYSALLYFAASIEDGMHRSVTIQEDDEEFYVFEE